MIFNVRNVALIYACLAATASTSAVFANDDPHSKPPPIATRTILKPALKKDTHGSKGLHQVKQGDGGAPGTRGRRRSIPKPALKKDPHGSNGLHLVKQGDDGAPGLNGRCPSIPKPALKKDPHGSKSLHAVKQGDDNGDLHCKPPTNATRTILKNGLKNDPHIAKSLQALNQEEECVDVPGWQDSRGFGCEYYSKGIKCHLFGWAFKNDGYTALEACCACGGGNVGGGDDDDDDKDDDDAIVIIVIDDDDDGVVYGLQPSCKSDDSDNFNLCLDLVSLSGKYESWMESFVMATKKWESIIVGDFPSIASSRLDDEVDPDLLCTSYPTHIDDVYICAREARIDGKDGVLGASTPVWVRPSGVVNPRTGEEYTVTLTGYMEFDSEDIAALQSEGYFNEVVLHEMAHVIGAGSLWVENGLYDEDSGEYATETHADDEWKAIGCSGPLPVEQHGGDGTAEGHWDEGCLGDEIMTGYLSGSAQPVSRITIGTFEDLGYLVDYSKADPFTIADLSVCGKYCPEARRGVRRRERRVKAKLDKDGEAAVMRYAKTALTRRHKEFEIAAGRHGDRDDGIKALEELNVLYKDAEGRLHTVHVTWNQVKDLHI